MSSPLTRANRYQYPPEPEPAPFNREIANELFGDINDRLVSIENKRIDLQSLIDDLSFFGIQRLDTAINPLIDSVKVQISDLQTAVAKTLEDNGKIITDFQNVTAVNLDALKAKIDEMQARINVVLAGGLDARDVRENADRVFVSPAQKVEIGQLRTDVELRAKIESPILTGAPQAPTPAQNSNDKTIVNSEFVKAMELTPLQIAQAISYAGVR